MALLERVDSENAARVLEEKKHQPNKSFEISSFSDFASSPLRPDGVGILAMEVYFPKNKVEQAELEKFDQVSAGKYTIGLGQRALAFPSDQEDCVSMSLTVVQSLLEKYSIAPKQIGRLEVGTESSVDRSKSVKSFLMALFRQSGNSDVQGVDCINACYGGTAALFNAVNWVESRSWDGRLAIVVAADVAVYASGPARATGGCGAVAMLIGPEAPLVLEPGFSAAFMDDVYDFYKPGPGIFPQVDGKLSISCYLTALDRCYQRLCQKVHRMRRRNLSEGDQEARQQDFSLAEVDYCVMHAPFAKMVRKGFARLYLQNCLVERNANRAAKPSSGAAAGIREHDGQPQGRQPVLDLETVSPATQAAERTDLEAQLQATLDRLASAPAGAQGEDPELQQASLACSAEAFGKMVEPGMLLGRECGNMYAASVHASLASLVFRCGSLLCGKRILINSFGSGLASSLFCIKARAVEGPFSLESMAGKVLPPHDKVLPSSKSGQVEGGSQQLSVLQLDLDARLAARTTSSPEDFTAALQLLERLHGQAGLRPLGSPADLFPGTFYLEEIDDRFRRIYKRREPLPS